MINKMHSLGFQPHSFSNFINIWSQTHQSWSERNRLFGSDSCKIYSLHVCLMSECDRTFFNSDEKLWTEKHLLSDFVSVYRKHTSLSLFSTITPSFRVTDSQKLKDRGVGVAWSHNELKSCGGGSCTPRFKLMRINSNKNSFYFIQDVETEQEKL
ncbi:hypothetical protein GOODEAATRI_024472 [Goodea atripinnis]|uniref:Uncharacterized protein n=1 Tax=Goodea atripinnis TaxID=208336 RepID=A0ABV0Q1K8_9TELE